MITLDTIRNPRFTRYELVDRGELVIFPHLPPCEVNIMIVVDANISFSHANFGLSTVQDTLRNNPEYFVKFNVTRAHRQIDNYKPDQATQPTEWARYGPHFENFRFTQIKGKIDTYDEIWLFGYNGERHATALTEQELEVLARWMDKGGGLLAMGDHADLGAAMCAEIPRVRSMRKWTSAQGVPPPTGSTRHDTMLKGHNMEYTFDDESDDVPMKIQPKYYPLGGWPSVYQNMAPHPVLCGQDGVIDILPDHPHEGEIIAEHLINLRDKFSFDNYQNIDEYPTHGVRPVPEVVAWAFVQDDHIVGVDVNKRAADPDKFGVIGVYDGHQAKTGHNQSVGRIVVDATWHHWFDINLIGRPQSDLDSSPKDATNPKTEGFLHSTGGQNALARIQNYYRNVAVWLAPIPKRNCMVVRSIWGMILRYPLLERLSPRMSLLELGETARNALGRRASQCVVRQWLLDDYVFDMPRDILEKWIPDPDPCFTCPPIEVLEIYALGGITRELLMLAEEMTNVERVDDREVDAETIEAVLQRGVDVAADQLLQDFSSSMERSQGLLEELRRHFADKRG